jgi:hypothetical protein
MVSNRSLCIVTLASMLCASAAFAQERGRTDGPENSEWGKGGYDDPGGGQFSLEFNWGASVQSFNAGPPLFVGLTASYWADDWFLLDVSGAYLFNNGIGEVLVGPRFRTAFYPVSGYLGLKAGAMFLPGFGLLFALSPQVGADILVNDKVILGLGYAADIPIGIFQGTAHRISMNFGYRF